MHFPHFKLQPTLAVTDSNSSLNGGQDTQLLERSKNILLRAHDAETYAEYNLIKSVS